MAGCSARQEVFDRETNAGYIAINGLSERFTVQKYAKLADLVVRGTVVSDVVRRFTENNQIPDSYKSDEMYGASYHDVTVAITEYIKGKGPDQISVRRLAPPEGYVLSGTAPEPFLGRDQVMFLSEGTGLWSGGYLVLGDQSLAEVVEGKVKLKTLPQMAMDDFRKEVGESEKGKS